MDAPTRKLIHSATVFLGAKFALGPKVAPHDKPIPVLKDVPAQSLTRFFKGIPELKLIHPTKVVQ